VMAAKMGIAAPFWFTAISNLAVIGALLWWHPPHKGTKQLPVERFYSAIRTGFRYARHNRHLGATLLRAVSFFLFASAYWALLPLVTRNQIAAGAELYGYLLGAIGAAAVATALLLPWLKTKLGPDRQVTAGTLGTALAMVLFGLAREPATAVVASHRRSILDRRASERQRFRSGRAARLGARARTCDLRHRDVRVVDVGQRDLGTSCRMFGLPAAHFLAAAGAIIAIPLTWRCKLQTGAAVDLTPSMHWPTPVLTHDIESDQGPVLVTVEYRIDPRDREPFLAAIEKLGQERRRDGAYAWGIFEDASEEGRMLETFLVESWLEHLRQHERVTKADMSIQETVQRFHTARTPKVTHLIART